MKQGGRCKDGVLGTKDDGGWSDPPRKDRPDSHGMIDPPRGETGGDDEWSVDSGKAFLEIGCVLLGHVRDTDHARSAKPGFGRVIERIKISNHRNGMMSGFKAVPRAAVGGHKRGRKQQRLGNILPPGRTRPNQRYSFKGLNIIVVQV